MKIIKLPKNIKFSNEIELVPHKINGENIYVKYYKGGVQAGFPSPAEDFTEHKLSLDERYVTNPDAIFIVRVKGNSMYPTLQIDDLLIVNSDTNLEDNRIGIISFNNSKFTVKRFDKANKTFVSDNKRYKTIQVNEEDLIFCKGVVAHLIRDL